MHVDALNRGRIILNAHIYDGEGSITCLVCMRQVILYPSPPRFTRWWVMREGYFFPLLRYCSVLRGRSTVASEELMCNTVQQESSREG